MGTFIIILIVVVSLALGLVVLIQSPKGDGLAEGFQGATQMGGVKKTTDFLSKATWVLAGVLFVLCLASAAFFSTSSVIETPDQEQVDAPSDNGGADDTGTDTGSNSDDSEN